MGPGFRTCSHAGCKWPAIVTLSFDYSAGQVWLEDLRTAPEVSAYDLCSVHAGRFRPPKGWMVDDLRRVPEPQFGVGASEPSKSDLAPPSKRDEAPPAEEPAVARSVEETAVTANGSTGAAQAASTLASPPADRSHLDPDPDPVGSRSMEYIDRPSQFSEESATSLLRRMEIREEDDEIAELKRLVARDI